MENVMDGRGYDFEEKRVNEEGEGGVGVGRMGVGEVMIKVGIGYGSGEWVEFVDKVYGLMGKEGYVGWGEIGGEKGGLGGFEG
ncbi:hypothetical protein, partial [Paenibacillus xylanexedens]|uniref:hypothetical protein n=1 Tax=Paenibacillus xylanexedens TaxID=528191 RepID=UPI0011AB244F